MPTRSKLDLLTIIDLIAHDLQAATTSRNWSDVKYYAKVLLHLIRELEDIYEKEPLPRL